MGQYKYSVIDYLDTPEVLDAAVTNIPGSGSNPVQVVASLAASATRIYVRDGIGTDFIGVYVGASGSEVLKCIIGCAGESQMDVSIPAASRVSLRSMSSSPITSGILCLMFLS